MAMLAHAHAHPGARGPTRDVNKKKDVVSKAVRNAPPEQIYSGTNNFFLPGLLLFPLHPIPPRFLPRPSSRSNAPAPRMWGRTFLIDCLSVWDEVLVPRATCTRAAPRGGGSLMQSVCSTSVYGTDIDRACTRRG